MTLTFQLLDSLGLPGDPAKPNEDSCGQDARAAVLIDGATPLGDGLMPGPSDAAWIAQFGVRRVLAHLRGGDGARKALRAALADTQIRQKLLGLGLQPSPGSSADFAGFIDSEVKKWGALVKARGIVLE